MNGLKVKIGVMGSAQGPTMNQADSIKKSREIGKWIAKSDCILVSGACPGLPDEAATVAKENGGMVVGISPAFSYEGHVGRYKSPVSSYDLILFTGMGLMERDIVNIRSSDVVIILGGGIGTLNEFTVAFEEGKIIGVLEGCGGVANHIPEIVKMCNRALSKRVIFDSNPKKLVEKILLAYEELPRVTVEDERIVKPGGIID